MKRVVVKMNKPSYKSEVITMGKEGEAVEVVCFLSGRRKGRYELEIIVDHVVGDNKGKVVVRGVAENGAELMIKGLVRIAPGAQKVEDLLDMKVLLLDERSRAVVDPQMEIEADNVKASHAVSVGKVDEEQLFYLLSRGFSRKCAVEMIVAGFMRWL